MKIFSFDIESSTGNHRDGSMCSFGYVVADENGLSQKDIVIKPKTDRFESRVKLHYEKEFILKQEPFPYHYEEIKNLFNGNDYIVGFSVSNDVEFLNNACELYKLPKIEYEFLDVQLLFKTVYKRPNLCALSTIAEELGIEYEAHRSDEDARVTYLVLKRIIEGLNMPLSEILSKYNITLGKNTQNEVIHCSNGILTHKEINVLILDFIQKNYKHSRRYKGGLSFKTFAFSDNIRYENVNNFRRIIKKIFDLNGKVSSIESSNIFVYNGEIPEKEKSLIDERNKDKIRIQTVSLQEFLKELGELPNIDFLEDNEFLRNYRLETKKRREEHRIQRRKEYFKNKSLENK